MKPPGLPPKPPRPSTPLTVQPPQRSRAGEREGAGLPTRKSQGSKHREAWSSNHEAARLGCRQSARDGAEGRKLAAARLLVQRAVPEVGEAACPQKGGSEVRSGEGVLFVLAARSARERRGKGSGSGRVLMCAFLRVAQLESVGLTLKLTSVGSGLLQPLGSFILAYQQSFP